MKNFPDVLGMELDEATALLEAEGLTFIVEETKAPRNPLTEGTLRVIKVQGSHSLVLTVCRI